MTKLTFIADSHYYSKTLGTTGRQYELRSGSDQKCLGETAEIIDAVFEQIANSDTQAVMIAGDVSNDGEMVSHREFREKLYELKKKKPIYLISATHDWCNDGNPRRFDGDNVYHDVEVMNAKELPEFYKDFGPSDALSKFITHIGTCSYVVQLDERVRLLALNDDKNEQLHAGFTEEHFQWIEEQIKKANDDGCLMIGMEHHLLTPVISPLITGGGTCVANREYVASRLADAGLKYMFVGHSHIQWTADFKSAKGNVIKQVNVGSIVGYPAPIVNVTVNDDMTLSYKVEHLKEFTLNGERIDAQEYLAKHLTDLLHRVLDCPDDKAEFADRMTALQMNGGKVARLYNLIHPIIKFINGKTIGEAYNNLKWFGIGRFVDKALVEEFKNHKITEFIDRILMSAMDGGIVTYDRESSYYKLVMSVVSIPSRLAKNNTNAKRFIFAIDAILTGGIYNNQEDNL